MAAVHTKQRALPRRLFLRGLATPAIIGLPPLVAMFNANGTAYAAEPTVQRPTRFVLWFNGNGIPEKYWIPRETGADFALTPCLAPLAPFRDDIHVVTGLDNPAARLPGPGNDHHRSMSALMSGTSFTGRGSGGASIDQLVAAKIGGQSRFRSLQIGVSQESFGESVQRNMSWAGADRALPPEMLPAKLFDRLFGARDACWIQRRKSILDAVQEDADSATKALWEGGPDPPRGAPHIGSRSGAVDRDAAPRLPLQCSTRSRRGYARLAAHCQAAKRTAGACARFRADARSFVHADQVPGIVAIPVAGIHGRPPSRLHACRWQSSRGRVVETASTSFAISANGTSKSSRTFSAG